MSFSNKRTIFSSLTIATVIAIVAFGFSTFLSGNGIYESLNGTKLSDELRMVVSIASTMLITALSFLFWSFAGRRYRERRMRKNIKSLNIKSFLIPALAGVLSLSVSSFTAFAALTYINYQDSVQAVLNRQIFDGMIQPMQFVSLNFADVAAKAETASLLATRRSNLEQQTGGTCGLSSPGTGPITTMRANHATQAQILSNKAKLLSQEAVEIAQKVAIASNQQQVATAYSAIIALASDNRRQSIVSEAKTMRLGYAGKGFFWDGRERLCNDPELAKLFLSITDAADVKFEIPDIPPKLRQVTLFDAIKANIDILSGKLSVQNTGIDSTHLFPLLGFALLIDIIGAASSFVQGKRRAARLTGEEHNNFHRVQWILENFVWSFPAGSQPGTDSILNHQTYLFVPHNGNPRRTKDAEYMAAFFDLTVDPSLQLQPVGTMRAELEPFIDRFMFASGGATHYSIYPILDQETYERMEHHKKEARRAIGFDYIVDENYPEFAKPDGGNVISMMSGSVKVA